MTPSIAAGGSSLPNSFRADASVIGGGGPSTPPTPATPTAAYAAPSLGAVGLAPATPVPATPGAATPAAQPQAAISGGGDQAAQGAAALGQPDVLAALTQVVTALQALVTALQAQQGGAQPQPGPTEPPSTDTIGGGEVGEVAPHCPPTTEPAPSPEPAPDTIGGGDTAPHECGMPDCTMGAELLGEETPPASPPQDALAGAADAQPSAASEEQPEEAAPAL